MRFPEWLKWAVAREEMEELNRWRNASGEYGYWFAGFDDVSAVLTNLVKFARNNAAKPIREIYDSLTERHKRGHI